MEKLNSQIILKTEREIEEVCRFSNKCDQMAVYDNLQDRLILRRNINIFNDSKYISYVAGLGIGATAIVAFVIFANNFLDFLEEYACNKENFMNISSGNISRVRR